MIDRVINSPKIQQFVKAIKDNESIVIEGLWNAPKALIAHLARQITGKNILLLSGGTQEEGKLFHDLSFFNEELIIDFPAWNALPTEDIAPSPDVVGERHKALVNLLQKKQPAIVVSSLQAVLQRVVPPEAFELHYLVLKVGMRQKFDVLLKDLEEMGYQKESVVTDKGQFAVRGGIVDIFPVTTPEPYRIEFWGDDIESIRTFDPVGQKSVLQVKEIEISLASEVEASTSVSILDYLGKETIIIFNDLIALEDRYISLLNQGIKDSSTFNVDQFFNKMGNYQTVYLSEEKIEDLSEVTFLDKSSHNYYSDTSPLIKLVFQMFNKELVAKRWQHSFVPIVDYFLPDVDEKKTVQGNEILNSLNQISDSDFYLDVLSTTDLEQEKFIERLTEEEISLPKNTTFHLGYLSSGFVLPEIKQVIFPLTEINHRFKIRRQKQRSTYHTVTTAFQDLAHGEAVVHLNHGIGKFIGLEKRKNHNGVMSEFLQLEYADQSKLYVPIEQTSLISKYIGATDVQPKLHTLGSSKWKKTKENTQKAILGYARDLLELYAVRALKTGHVYRDDSPDMHAFEEDFPFVETEDQLAAIAAIKDDMTSNRTMDRLICGDVGYGKTEVAMRASFKAVVDGGKQVAVLVPTTVLAMQHYENFLERMSNFPINIGVMSRFRTQKEIRETLEKVANGSIDILIGTHRIISGDVTFKNLGLIIIDEEQRFGVRAKETLKKAKVNVDCLTLSATPIPRTLYMSLMGARDMSVINTPPQDRLPITTYITEPTEQVLRNALLRELNRDGQAFVIHNRVETIYDTKDRIQKLLPQARVVVAHGQMHSDEIDQVFHAFKSGQADILVATTIVENGIDIPNANTILIEKADHFGMADLYQLRGRVGRWNRSAYAYFLVKGIHKMPELSRKRLMALAQASGYGGGMKVAMSDLEIRGAGNILGEEQSGHVEAIGFHLYCKLLKRTIQSLEGKVPAYLTDTKLEYSVDARIPEEYIANDSLRMEFYQRFGEALALEEVDDLLVELKDRFGKPPLQVLYLFGLTKIRVVGSLKGYTLIKIEKLSLTTEQKIKEQLIVKKILIGKVEKPEDLDNVLQLLQGKKS